ncbi:MAG: hypothetical protein EAS48_06765 [Chryseobacterium sp.]|nr:MAG: hypothetical protein EAS48_06765 [Chryseobacterium sp.]
MPKFLLCTFFLLCFGLKAQVRPNDSIRVEQYPTDTLRAARSGAEVLADIEKSNAPADIRTFSPIKAGLYSAVLPGLGQFYNRKYWKIPIVYAAIGTGAGVIVWNNKQYRRYREAFVAELNGLPHEFSDIRGVTAEVLGNRQDQAKRQRDYTIAITAGIYILNIVDAVVDAHLYEAHRDPDLALSPSVIYDEGSKMNKAALTLNYRF